MNFEHLDMIQNQYIQNFDELNAREGHDEGYKWRAVRCFQEQWNRDESAWEDGLAGKFKAATKETEILVDNAWVQPNAGILALLKHKQEEDFVRACFEELFCADNGDLNKRWDRIVAFMEKINDRLDHYGKPKTYRQTNNSVIYYLNLWRPEEITYSKPLKSNHGRSASNTVMTSARANRSHWISITGCAMNCWLSCQSTKN